mmetsp:Transcript_14092/g.21135  ORF Transcript_14092/g.21135 Transcript_14092/m.21135 type:complete len:233 (-) Transcript_14092:400-1098(-)
MEQDVSFHTYRMVKLRLLHLRTYFSHGLSNFFLFCLCFWHVFLTELGATCKYLWETLIDSVLVECVMKPGVSIIHNILLSKFGRIGVVSPNAKRNDDNHNKEVCHQDKVAVVCVKEPRWKTNTDLKTLFTIRVTIFLIVLLGRGICESLVSLSHHHKHSFCRRVIGILVRVIHQTHLFVSLLDLLRVCASIYSKDVERIKRVHFTIIGDRNRQVYEEKSAGDCEEEVDNKRL